METIPTICLVTLTVCGLVVTVFLVGYLATKTVSEQLFQKEHAHGSKALEEFKATLQNLAKQGLVSFKPRVDN